MIYNLIANAEYPVGTTDIDNAVAMGGHGFPFTIPAGKIYRVHMMALVNKYFESPTPDHHTVYFSVPFWSCSAHHPETHFTPPRDFPAGYTITAQVLNGQSEPQVMYAYMGGELLDATDPPPAWTLEERVAAIEARLAAANIP